MTLLTGTIYLLIGVMQFLESVDPDLDIMTPGSTHNVLAADAAEKFSNSWRDVPIIGKYVADVGLPGTLAWGMVVVTCFQVTYFVWFVNNVRLCLQGKANWGVLGLCDHVGEGLRGCNLLPLVRRSVREPSDHQLNLRRKIRNRGRGCPRLQAGSRDLC